MTFGTNVSPDQKFETNSTLDQHLADTKSTLYSYKKKAHELHFNSWAAPVNVLAIMGVFYQYDSFAIVILSEYSFWFSTIRRFEKSV